MLFFKDMAYKFSKRSQGKFNMCTLCTMSQAVMQMHAGTKPHDTSKPRGLD